MSHDNECITCRSRRKTGEVWIKHKVHDSVVLCPKCAKDVKGEVQDWDVIKDSGGLITPEEAKIFNAVAERLIDQYGCEGGSEFTTEWGVFYFSPNK